MTIVSGPSIVRDNLIFSTDFDNPKSYYPNENLYTYSEDPTGYTGGSNFTIFVNTASTTSPIGNTSSSLVILANTASNYNNIGAAYSTATNGYYTISYYVKIASTTTVSAIFGTNGYGTNTPGGMYLRVVLDLNSGRFSSPQFVSSSTVVTTINDFAYGVSPAPYGWTRVWITANLTTATTFYQMTGGLYIGTYGNTIASAGTGVYIWGFQLERNAVPTTYVPTRATPITKSTNVYDLTVPYKGAFVGTPYYTNDSVIFNLGVSSGTYCDILGLPVSSTSSWTNKTLSVWFKCKGPNVWGSTQGLVYYWDGASNPQFGFDVGSDGLSVAIQNATQNLADASAGPATGQVISLNTWYHAVGVENHDTGAHLLTLYLNGVYINTNSYTAIWYTALANQIRIGCQKTFQPRYFNGQISNVQLYNRSLNADEIKQLFNSMRGRYGL